MNTIRAVVVDPTVPGRLTLQEVPHPIPQPQQAVVRVSALSLNRGEVRRSLSADAGWRPGWDLAGVIETAAADGSGFPTGTRVVGFLSSGAWAELVCVPTHSLAEIPDSVSFAIASTLPVAGLTALLALERGGLLLGKSILITGASGGVGHAACQLAHHAGAKVIAHIRRLELIDFVKAAGAEEVVVGDDISAAAQYEYDLILDSVGGNTLTTALNLLAKDGTCVIFGTTSGAEITFNASRFYGKGGLSLYGFILFHELEKQPASFGLKKLVNLVAEGSLRPHIDLEAPWTQVAEIAQQLTDRQFVGKAVLHISN
ncbi:MAG: zinc-binding dehydrogenase [Cyanomargarita calcarea GSE-NOS-MK-12-04C]|uniref:Zinc-binding dehydrogenase n=1 Tax=Cyanomargarita calcarea GSE-NOS-MK-12-04C TaxID=2839659 RepID=A0A951QJW5_9CYAN|nr:zinc-binding dehydrogenase [Cyanomargarita calcarea GSE-NOS-MK-12-04C]